MQNLQTENTLKHAGYENIEVYLTEAQANFNSKKDYFVYLKIVD
jgi:hypothetical protein